MRAHESFQKKEKAIGLTEEEQHQREAKQPTIKEILANPAQSDLFGEYLGMEGDEALELGAKLKMGDASSLGRDEFLALEEHRKQFLEIMERSKNVIEVLDAKTLKQIIENSEDPNVKALAGVAGPDAMKNAVKNYLPRMAILDRERFAELSEKAVQLKETRQQMAEDDKEIEKFCREHHIDTEEYVKLIQSGDQDGLIKLLRSRMGGFKKLWNNPMRLRGKMHELDKAPQIRARLDELEDDLRSVGLVLESSLMENETMHQALVTEMTKEGVAQKPEAGMSFSEMKHLNDEDLKKTKEAFTKSLVDQSLDPDGIPDERYEEEVEKFSRSYFEAAKKGKKGFWASIWESISAPKLTGALKRKTT